MRLSLLSGLMSVIVAMLIVTGGAMAGTNAVDGSFAADFEAYSSGDEIASTNNVIGTKWIATAATHMTATNAPSNTLPPSQQAMPGSAHTMVAKLATESSFVTNHLAGSGVDSVWLDMNIQMVPSDAEPTASITNDNQVQTALYMGTNGQLNIYHSTYDGSIFGSNQFSELSHTAMDTGTWHRLTVAMDYKSASAWSADVKFCQVTLDGTVVDGEEAWVDPANPLSGISNGTWFVCANNTTIADHINMALFSGTGYLDDFVVTNGAPTQTMITYYTNGVPGWWLAGYGFAEADTTAGSLKNDDGDMYAAWAEWMLGTDPTSSNSFQLMVESSGGTNVLKWLADGTMDAGAPDIMLQKSTNLLDGYTSTVTVDRANMSAGMNSWEDTTGTGDAMYRLGVSN